MNELFDILNGTLLGDSCIPFNNYKYKKYFDYKITARDQKFLFWFDKLLKTFKINNSWITKDSRTNFSLYFYINNCPYPELMKLRENWYKERLGKSAQKVVPRELQLTPTVLLHWYLGDGSLIRRKNDFNRVPYVVLATNTFSKNDIELLIRKLKELDLNFYPVKYKSGFTKKECGYCLYSNTQDGTPFRFFKLIGLKCTKEIVNCSTGRKGIYHEEKFFKDKWPTEEDWIKILSNVKIGKILRERRLKLGLTQNQLAKKIGIRRESIRDVELERRNFSVKNLRKVLKALNLDIFYLLNNLR